jgi:hypothetical protein
MVVGFQVERKNYDSSNLSTQRLIKNWENMVVSRMKNSIELQNLQLQRNWIKKGPYYQIHQKEGILHFLSLDLKIERVLLWSNLFFGPSLNSNM